MALNYCGYTLQENVSLGTVMLLRRFEYWITSMQMEVMMPPNHMTLSTALSTVTCLQPGMDGATVIGIQYCFGLYVDVGAAYIAHVLDPPLRLANQRGDHITDTPLPWFSNAISTVMD